MHISKVMLAFRVTPSPALHGTVDQLIYHTNVLHAVAPRTVSLGILPGDDRTLGPGPKRLMCIKRETQQKQSFLYG